MPRRKLSEDVWKDVCGVFDCLPVAATIGGRILCLHGGISPHLRTLDDIDAIRRPTVLDHEDGGLLTDLVWSDPTDEISGRSAFTQDCLLGSQKSFEISIHCMCQVIVSH